MLSSSLWRVSSRNTTSSLWRMRRRTFGTENFFAKDESRTPTQRLVSGFEGFRQKYFVQSDNRALFEKLATGQAPKTLMVGCADSRVDPAIVTDCGPGEIFMLRNIAAIVPPYSKDGSHHATSAGLEYGVRALGVENIIIMGHAKCGGVAGLGNPKDLEKLNFDFVQDWVKIVHPALEVVNSVFTPEAAKETGAPLPPQLQASALEKAVVLTSLNNLLTFPWILERVQNNTLQLYGWYFDLAKGQLLGFDPRVMRFVSLHSSEELVDSSTAFMNCADEPSKTAFLDSVRQTIINDCKHHSACAGNHN